MIIAASIFSIVSLALYGVLDIARSNYDINLISLNLRQQVSLGINKLNREIREAYYYKITITPQDSESDEIKFSKPGLDGVEDMVDIKYRIKSQVISGKTFFQLIREYPQGSEKVIANDIKKLKFSKLANNSISIEIQASKACSLLGKEHVIFFPAENVNAKYKVRVRN